MNDEEMMREIKSLRLKLETAQGYCEIWRKRCLELEDKLFKEMMR